MKKTIKKLPKSQLLIEVSIPETTFDTYYDKAIKHAGEHVDVAGFRKGKAPKEIIEKNINQMAVLEEMANMAINEHLPKILVDEKIDAIGRPSIMIKKIAKGNPLEFEATVAVFPEIDLPDYKKIAKEVNKNKRSITVSDEDLDKAIVELKKARKAQEERKNNPEDTKNEKAKKTEEENIDASVTEEYVKLLGPFETVEDFKEKFRENIKMEEEAREREKRRIETLEKIQGETNIELPEVLIESELENLIGRLKADIGNLGIPFEEYLKHVQKTEEEIRKEFMPDAEKRAKMELIMHKIGLNEKSEPKEEDIKNEVERLMKTYPDADPNRAIAYVTHLLANEEILKFLESQE